MRRLCSVLIPCAAAVAVAVAPAGAAPFHDMPAGAGAARVADDVRGMAHAFLYEDGTMTGLNDPHALDDLIDPVSGWESAEAKAPDDVGRLAATACKADACHAARLAPAPVVPEPSAPALLGAGLALLGWRRHQAWSFTPLAPRCPG